MEAEAQDPTWSQLRNSKRWQNQFKRDKTWRDWNGYQTPFLQTKPGEWINYVIYEVKVKGWYQCTKQHANDMHRGHEGECSIYSQTSALASRSGCLYLWGNISTIGQEERCIPKSSRTCWWRENFPTPLRNLNPSHSVCDQSSYWASYILYYSSSFQTSTLLQPPSWHVIPPPLSFPINN